MSISPDLTKKNTPPEQPGGEQQLATTTMQHPTISLPATIPTERLRLRPFSLGDINDIMQYATDERWSKFLPVPQPYTREDGIAFLELQAKVDMAIAPCWAIEYEGKVVGGINIRFDPTFTRGVLGYSIAPAVWRRGLITEAAHKIVDLGFEGYPQLGKIAADANSQNVASLKVMKKLGMQRESVSEQHRRDPEVLVEIVTCSLSREAWLASRSRAAAE